jgi:tripartite-type tricarboxylate transporter receptor subunit TctC
MSSKLKKVILTSAMVCMATAGVAAFSQSSNFPNQPIKLVIPYPPGGALSVLGALVTTSAEEHFGQPMISLVRAGGGGATGSALVAQSEPDGYTLLLGEPTIVSLRPQVENLPYKIDDFIPIARLTQSPILFVAADGAPFSDLKGMIDYAKSSPNKLVYSSDNKNGWTYTAFELLKNATGTEMKGIEFGGGGPAITNVLGGNTMAYAGDPGILIDHIKAGKLKPICIADSARYALLKDVPTCKEAGADVEWGLWIGVLAKKGTPADRIEKLRSSFAALAQDKGFLRIMARTNTSLAYMDGDQFAKFVADEQASLKKLYGSK